MAQKTRLQVNLPIPANCGTPALSACTDAQLLNQLDGFSVNPQIVVCFSGPVQLATLAGGIHLYPITSFGKVIGINQILFDPQANCMYAKPTQVLAQDTNYLLTVTDSILDGSGNAVHASQDFNNCMAGGSLYCAALAVTVPLFSSQFTGGQHITAASLFTTMSTTDWVEKARMFVNAPSTPFAVLPAGNPTIFSLSAVTSMTWIPQDNQPTPTPQSFPLTALAGVDKVAFGSYLSPNFLNTSGPLAGSITVTPTGGPISPPVPIPGLTGVPPGYEPVSFHVFLPRANKAPAKGFPVVIYGHGLGDNQFGASTFMASTLAANGFATLSIEVMGHGFGPQSIVQVGVNGGTATVSTPGRGVALAPGAPIGPTDGCILPGALAIRDCGRQTAVDLFALVRTIRATRGLGLNIDPSRIYYVGQSFGSLYGSLYHAVEPNSRAAVLNTVGGSEIGISRMAETARPLADYYLGSRNPPLLNVLPPFNAPLEPYFTDPFNDNYVFRNSPPVLNNVPGAIPVQQALEVAEWADMNGDALAFAELINNPPPSSHKSTLVQFAFGDFEVPNPTNSAFIRAAGLQTSSWFYRWDRAVGLQPQMLADNSHIFLSNPTIFNTGQEPENSVAIAAQQQAASYFASDGASNPNPNGFLKGVFGGATLFEVPATLPEGLNYFLQFQP